MISAPGPFGNPPEIALIIPAHDEERTIGAVIREFSDVSPDAYLVVVDNNSRDATSAEARRALEEVGARGEILFEPRQGKGIAIRTALQRVEAKIYGIVDADCTYPATELPRLVREIARGADLVVGDRISTEAYQDQAPRRFHVFGNRMITSLVNRLYGSSLKDVLSGYRVFNRTFAKSVPLLHDGFEVEAEMTVFALDRRLRIAEVPIEYRPRPPGSESKLETLRDGFRIVRLLGLLFKDFRPFAFFGSVGALTLVLGLAVGAFPVVEYLRFQYVYRVPSAVLAVGLVLVALICFATGLILDTVVNVDRRNFERQVRRDPVG